MHNFGNENVYATYSPYQDTIAGEKHTCPANGEAQSISINILSGWDSGEKYKCAIYRANRTLLGVTEERSDGGSGWQVFNFSDPKPILLADTDYILALWTDCAALVSASSGAPANSAWSQVKDYDTFPGLLDAPTSSWYKSIYCTYEEVVVGWTGKISGVTNPAKIMGVDVANIAKVKGVASA